MSEYIGRQAVMKIIDDYGTTHGSVLGSHSGAVDVVGDIIYNLPVADVAPVVHGRWIRFKETDPETGYIHMRCSVCSAYWSDPSHADHFRYCPNCGAKMDRRNET